MKERLAGFRHSHWPVLMWALALFSVCFALNTRHNGFAFFYHPDEPGKVEQVLTGRWNFNHPMLLLSTTKAVVETLQIPAEPQAIVEAGRRVSAFFAAAAIVALSILAYLWRGWGVALIVGVTLLWRGSLLPLGREAALKPDALGCVRLTVLGLLRRPAGASSLATKRSCAVYSDFHNESKFPS
jgi:hypothetical protein